MSILRLTGVRREVGQLVILDGVDAAVAAGDRIGLVGPNGAGKTTLLRIAAGHDEPDGGDVGRRRGLSLGFLAQEAHLDAAFMDAADLRTAVRHGAGLLEAMEAELAAHERDGRTTEPSYADLQHRFEALGGYTLDQRVEATLSGLGFVPADLDRPPARLSGGEQTRAALARLLVEDPDLLLLDEPTNHLDIAALEWLEERLQRRTGALVVASHDRAFLDATVGRIWELRDRRLTTFRGAYGAYVRQRAERDTRLAVEAASRTAEIARERELVQRYRSHRKYSKMHEHEARLDGLQTIEQPPAGRRLALPGGALVGGSAGRSGELVVRAHDMVVGYGGPTPSAVATIRFLEARRGERVGIVGPNGAGKTTLLRTIAGELPPLDGRLELGRSVSIGYLAQLRGAHLPGATVLDAILGRLPVTPGKARGHLARFLFRGDEVFKEVRALSGGERSRLELALLGLLPANLLLLDEPTNHLDIPAREAIEAFLGEVAATILLVSHDRRLLETVCDRLWVVDAAQAAPYDAGYRAWRGAVTDGWTVAGALETEARRLRAGRRAVPDASTAGGAATPPTPVRAPANGPAAVRPGRPARLSKDAYRRQKASVEGELTRLGLRKSHLELALGDPAVHGNFVELRRITSELADVQAALESAEETWLRLEERAP